MNESILNSIKKFLGISDDDISFDPELILIINGVLQNLSQIGRYPKNFRIIDSGSTWGDFLIFNENETVKSYVSLKVKMIFDPPANSIITNSLESAIKELEWRLMIDSEEIT